MGENSRQKFKERWIDIIFYSLVFVFIGYQMYYIKSVPFEPTVHAILHLGFAMTLCSWARLRKVAHRPLDLAITILVLLSSVAVTAYFFLSYKAILANPSYPPPIALILGVIASITALVLVRWSFGWLFPIFSFLAVLYVLYGTYLPGTLRAPSISFQRAVTLLASDVTSPWGLYGDLLGLSANYLFLFIIFGSVLHAFGGLRFIIQLGSCVASKLRSGPAALAVVSSALLGSITGSTAANITITGSFTIPLMKKAGYKPEQAAAIEAAASNGGQFLPPIMGATVFVMAAYTGIPYLEIAKAAIIPALMYFLMLLLYAELNARKLNISSLPYQLDRRAFLLDAPLFILPVTTLMVMLIIGYSLMMVVFWSVISVVVLGLLSGLRRDVRINWLDVRDKFAEGALLGANVALILAIIGIAVAALEVTGLTLKLSVILGNLAGNSLFLLLFFTMLTSLLLGTGVPTPAAYVIVATVLSPVLIMQGLPKMQAHLFPMFYAFISHLTPPIGIGLLIACKLSGSDYIRGAIEVFKAAFPSVFLPFFFVYAPEILLQYDTFYVMVLSVFSVSMIFFTATISLNKQWVDKLYPMEHIILISSCILFLAFIFLGQNPVWILMGTGLCVLSLFRNYKHSASSVAMTDRPRIVN
jgi:TRAP transporter 4TM/12TM fusion protein